ncbi:hypothetical protein OG496_05250 [Streptomyces sp. NBC_00988]|uniref:hypothetical protein n=1 Tax=Streptomyces sp. NBC_00988 TaxID=2903704 RepID=UPI0038684BC4|nr:hypothetical protein OG496_05250 [Streptomyces sp. NBC_00988]
MTSEHHTFLNAAAITDEVIEEYGIRSVTGPDDIPGEIFATWSDFLGEAEKGILFFWPVPGREPVPQYRPDDPIETPDGKLHKYLLPKGCGSFVAVFREPTGPDDPYLITEGTKQTHAALSWAPPEWGIAGVPGCNNWAGADLSWADGHKVIVLFDADMSTNSDVWDAAAGIKEALEVEGADEVVFARLAGAKAKEGLDDVLGRRPENRRTSFIENVADRATDKLGRRPKQKARKPDPVEPPDTGGRASVIVNADRKAVIENITEALTARWDGETLFDYGGAITLRKGAELEPLERSKFLNVLVEACACFTYREATTTRPASFEDAWPDAPTVEAVLGRAPAYTPVTRIVRAPFVREDGTVCAAGGYDEASRTWLELDGGLTITVPVEPSAEEIASALKLLSVDLLGDFPFPEESDRAGALALLLTPFIRDRIDLAPLAVVDGLQMGVGKNLLADVVSILATGEAAVTQPLSGSNEEVRKQMTATLRSGNPLVVFDEAHKLEGRALAQVLTTPFWRDRVLGVSENIQLPNTVTWVALGNNVSVEGDISRRVYWIRLHPAYANPQDRRASSFRHADLKEWATEHRAELLSAVLTLVRAWYAAGCPFTQGAESFGSFTRWERTIGGILQTAGVPGFLGGLRAKRTESDWTGVQWAEHFVWLADTFGSTEFTTADVKDWRQVRGANSFTGDRPTITPPGLEDTTPKDWSRKLGYAYRGVLNQIRGGLRLVKSGTSHGHVTKYVIQVVDEAESTSSGGDGGDGYSYASAKTLSSPREERAREEGAHVEKEPKTSPPSPPSPPSSCTCVPDLAEESDHAPWCALGTED